MKTDRVIGEKGADGVASLTFSNEARRNAITLAMSEEASAFLEDYASDPAVHLLVISGAGEHFVSGADISEFEALRAEPEAIARYEAISSRMFTLVRTFPKPTIAKIRGFCFGGGLGLAAACDLRFASHDSRYSIPAARLGIAYRTDMIEWLMHIVGAARLKEILITARHYDAAEARAMGLVHQVAPRDGFEAAFAAYVAGIAQNAPLSTYASKHMVDEYSKPGEPPDLVRCQELAQACLASEDYAEGRRAFMEKRRPVFKGR